MGFYGWNVLQDQVTIRARVTAHSRSTGFLSDGDWNLEVRPLPAFASFLAAPNKPPASQEKNAQGLMDCEVHLADSINTDSMESSQFAHLVGQVVEITGVWVEDKSHGKKTEVHPIMAMVLDPAPLMFQDTRVHPWELYLSVDDFRGGEVVVDRAFPFGPGGDCGPVFMILGETSDGGTARSFTLTSTVAGGGLSTSLEKPAVTHTLNIHAVAQGPPNPGFFHCLVAQWYDHRLAFDPETNTSVLRQSGWAWCHKCKGLWYTGSVSRETQGPSTGSCPMGGGHEVPGGGTILTNPGAFYTLVNNVAQAPGQHGWRWCRKCEGLWFAGGGSQGVCPAVVDPVSGILFNDPDGGKHVQIGSGDYSLVDSEPGGPGEAGWRWCHNCQGLWTSN